LWSIVWLVSPPSRVRPSKCTPVTPAVPYLLLGLQDVQRAVGNSRGARKLTRTPHVNKKNKKNNWIKKTNKPFNPSLNTNNALHSLQRVLVAIQVLCRRFTATRLLTADAYPFSFTNWVSGKICDSRRIYQYQV
jgi:hypothetical protein